MNDMIMNQLLGWDQSYYERLASFVREKRTYFAENVLRVPFEFYRSKEVADREWERIFKVFPLPLAHCSEIPEPTSYSAKTMMGRPLLFTRDKNGKAHAFENVCRHRAAQVVGNGCGKHGVFNCPYHGWSYNSEGKLVGVPWKEGFEGMDRATHGLTELPCEERHGLIWIILTPGKPIDVASFLGADMDQMLAGYGLDQMTLMEETPNCPTRIPMPCNWKAFLAGFQETYHFDAVHANGILAKFALPATGLTEERGRHSFQLNASPDMLNYIDKPIEQWRELPVCPHIYIFPCTTIDPAPRGVNISRMMPDASGDVRNSEFELTFLGYTPEMVEPVYDAVLGEDVRVLRTMQLTQPTASHGYEIVGRNEAGVQHALKAIAAEIDVELLEGWE